MYIFYQKPESLYALKRSEVLVMNGNDDNTRSKKSTPVRISYENLFTLI